MKHPTASTDPESFFIELASPRQEARTMASDVICLLLIWMADGRTLEDRGLRATVALYCIRPDLIDGMTLDGIGVLAGCSGKRFISWQPRSATQRACKHEHRASTPSDARFWRR